VTPDEYPYCGAEWLPHATFADSSPAPILCDLPLHGLDTMHFNEERQGSWQWQYADATWRPR
jgi:hypothetical protein